MNHYSWSSTHLPQFSVSLSVFNSVTFSVRGGSGSSPGEHDASLSAELKWRQSTLITIYDVIAVIHEIYSVFDYKQSSENSCGGADFANAKRQDINLLIFN
jgi:hypothetical protein